VAAAESRWVRYPIAGTTSIASIQEGTRKSQRGTAATTDSFTILGGSANQIRVKIDEGTATVITLSSGTALDPRFVARDIQRKIQSGGGPGAFAQVEFSNFRNPSTGFGQFVIYSGRAGTPSGVIIDDVGIPGGNSALSTLGLSGLASQGGDSLHLEYTGSPTAAVNTAYNGTVTASGVYRGGFDDVYNVVISTQQAHSDLADADSGNLYGVGNSGVATAGGFWNAEQDDTYTITVDTTNGQTTGGGTGNVPTFTVSSIQGDNVVNGQEMLYSNTEYYIGTKGLTLKWSYCAILSLGF